MSKLLESLTSVRTDLLISIVIVFTLPCLYGIFKGAQTKTRNVCIGALFIAAILFLAGYYGLKNTHYGLYLSMLPLAISDLYVLGATAKTKLTTRTLVFGALFAAIAFVLSYIKFFEMPQGGSLTPASMLPVMLFAYIFGAIPGALVGLVYGLLQYIQAPYFMNVLQVALDYFLAFSALSLAGVFKTKNSYINLGFGITLAGLARYFCSFAAGVAFYYMYAPEGQSVVVYSLAYNSFIMIETVMCLVIAMLPPVNNAIESMRKNQLRNPIK